MHRIKIIILLICIPMTLWSQGVKTTVIDFPILNGEMTLRGVLSEPENTLPNAPLLVLVSPPQPHNRDSGLFKVLSDTLNKHGFVTFRYDNRNFSDTINAKPNEGRYTMHDGADDLHDVLAFLKSQNRSIGLIGHSEGGSISIIETARNQDVQFLLLLATTGTSGEQLALYQYIERMGFLFNRLSPQEINRLKYSFYYPIHILANNPNNEVAFSKLRVEARSFYKENFLSGSFGKMSENKYVETIVEKWTKDARVLDFLRFNPADYFPTIKCPVFMAYAKDDNLVRWQENKESLERILMENGHLDFLSVAIDSVTHSFEDSGGINFPIFVSVHRRDYSFLPGNGFSKLCKHIVEWIEDKNVKIPER